ncbi:HNH endonuclease [Nakamurella sp. PAMC28650]|uniref:HNH endonuclease n=1 Tax=Nakamurella sp. PAMC28650 TaxID=2762325 RepID=UPI00351B962A
MKQAVWARDRGACAHCGAGTALEFDHVIPLSRGGATTVNNLQILCQPCNSRKSNHIE